jgi:hypothetical protein
LDGATRWFSFDAANLNGGLPNGTLPTASRAAKRGKR